MSLNSVISNGGTVLVVPGRWSDSWNEFRDHPRLIWWDGEAKDIIARLKNHNGMLPDTVRAVILSRFVGHPQCTQIIAEAKKRRALICPMKSTGEISRVLREFLEPPPTPKEKEKATVTPPARPTPPAAHTRGFLIAFVAQHHQDSPKVKTEGERLYKLAVASGLKTTEDSVIQAVGKYRRSLTGVATVPRVKPEMTPVTTAPAKAAAAPPEITAILGMIDDSIAGMQLIRENVLKLHRQTNEAGKLKARLAALLEGDL